MVGGKFLRCLLFLFVQDIDNGRLLETDTYFDHVELIDNPLKVLLITSRLVEIVCIHQLNAYG